MPIILVQAAPPAATRQYILDPVFEPMRAPGPLEPYYPRAALENGVDGIGIVECDIADAGTFTACRATVEVPQGQGFGAAAVQIAMFSRMKPVTRSGAPVGGKSVKLAIRFRLPWTPPDAVDSRALTTVVPRSVWARIPQGADFARAFPERAQRLNVEGDATVRCRAADDGSLTACVTVSETPADQNFGDAALALSKFFKIDISKRPGQLAIGKEVTLPIRFRLPRG